MARRKRNVPMEDPDDSTIHCTFDAPDELVAEARAIADQQDTSFAAVCRKALRAYVQQHKGATR